MEIPDDDEDDSDIDDERDQHAAANEENVDGEVDEDNFESEDEDSIYDALVEASDPDTHEEEPPGNALVDDASYSTVNATKPRFEPSRDDLIRRSTSLLRRLCLSSSQITFLVGNSREYLQRPSNYTEKKAAPKGKVAPALNLERVHKVNADRRRRSFARLNGPQMNKLIQDVLFVFTTMNTSLRFL
jgi:hypothetical protein